MCVSCAKHNHYCYVHILQKSSINCLLLLNNSRGVLLRRKMAKRREAGVSYTPCKIDNLLKNVNRRLLH